MGTDEAALEPRRRRQLVALVVVLSVLLAIPIIAGAAVLLGREPSFPAVSADVLLPLPPELERSSSGGFGCPTSPDGRPRIGYAVIRGDDGQIGGRLDDHLRSIGFDVAESDKKWHGLVAHRGDERVIAGSAADYLGGFPSDPRLDPLSVTEVVSDSREPHAVVALTPAGAECPTGDD